MTSRTLREAQQDRDGTEGPRGANNEADLSAGGTGGEAMGRNGQICPKDVSERGKGKRRERER